MADGKRIVEEWQSEWRGSAAPTYQSLARRIDALVAQRVAEEREACEGILASRATSMRMAMESTPKSPARNCYQCAFNELASAQQAIRRRGEER